MNRGQGLATGAVLVLGAFLRPGGSQPAPQVTPPTSASQTAAAAAEDKLQGEGPWTASCHYWEPARSLAQASVKRSSTELALEFKSAHGKAEGKFARKEAAAASECDRDGDPWGIPSPSRQVKPHITAILAAVPDPVHTHLALEYDRAVDALMQAAADNGYLRSFYWMPWKNPGEAPRAGETGDSAEQRKREEQPGLVVLKHVAANSGKDELWSSYDRVIYLFLVGESPASGMNGMQLRNALRYERDLLARAAPPVHGKSGPIEVDLSMRKGQMAVIGASASGAAAGLREALEQARLTPPTSHVPPAPLPIDVAGATETRAANDILNGTRQDGTRPVTYHSFGEDTEYEERNARALATEAGYHEDRFAVLVEDGTVFGQNSGGLAQLQGSGGSPRKAESTLVIRFPREISLLRNAQNGEPAATSGTPSPYLHLTLKDSVADDTIPNFSTGQTPLSQEAALMSIQRDLLTYRAQFLAIYASDVLDEIFLANFLHRACPNIRLVFIGGGDLLWVREGENQSYIGSLTITPYNLVGLTRRELKASRTSVARAFPAAESESFYNAASYTFHNDEPDAPNPVLAGYQTAQPPGSSIASPETVHASLWATIIGGDGYYPMGIVSTCASETEDSMASFTGGQPGKCQPRNEKDAAAAQHGDELQQFATTANIYPSLLWTVLSLLLALYCVAHAVMVLVARYWSPFTRDLAIRENDQPGRRAVYMNIGSVMLFCMSFVLNAPLFSVGPVIHPDPRSVAVACLALLAGLGALVCTLQRTAAYAWRRPSWPRSRRDQADGQPSQPAYTRWSATTEMIHSNRSGYLFFNLMALFALTAVPILWWRLCTRDLIDGLHTEYGIFFSYRCLHPDSGVSPVVPVFLLLLAWYLWAVCQTYRMRFSKASRPRLPRGIVSTVPVSLYVSDCGLRACGSPQDNCLYDNIGCLLITREMLVRFVPTRRTLVTAMLSTLYILLFLAGTRFKFIESVDRLLLHPGRWATRYEGLIAGLLMPLGFITLAGLLRMALVWGSLRRGVLEALERVPLRAAFTRLKGLGWVVMMRETGLHLRWRDMARTSESIRQLVHNAGLRAGFGKTGPYSLAELDLLYDRLNLHLGAVRANSRGQVFLTPLPLANGLSNTVEQDLPNAENRASLDLVETIEKDYAVFCEILLGGLLIPYWMETRGGFVEGVTAEGTACASCTDPEHIRLAEEMLALRYLSLIRGVLGNIRYIMTFVSAVYVLALIAWNSYPFQPRQTGDWLFTIAFLLFGGAVFWIFAQMHRDAILSRITDTSPNALGFDFYWRIATFGAIPLLTWLAYQFPQIGSGIFRVVQPGLSVLK